MYSVCRARTAVRNLVMAQHRLVNDSQSPENPNPLCGFRRRAKIAIFRIIVSYLVTIVGTAAYASRRRRQHDLDGQSEDCQVDQGHLDSNGAFHGSAHMRFVRR